MMSIGVDGCPTISHICNVAMIYIHDIYTSITIGNAQISFKQSVKNFDFALDCHLTMNAHVSKIVHTCYL